MPLVYIRYNIITLPVDMKFILVANQLYLYMYDVKGFAIQSVFFFSALLDKKHLIIPARFHRDIDRNLYTNAYLYFTFKKFEIPGYKNNF